jgi:hypothetical protein
VAWSAAGRHASQIDLSRSRAVQNEASIAVDPSNPNLLVAASQDLGVCGIRTYASNNGGKEWSSRPLLVADPSATRKAAGKSRFCAVNQWVAAGQNGRQYVAFIQNGGFRSYGIFFSSRQYPQAWSVPRLVDPTLTSRGFDDKPVVAVDNSVSSPHAGRVYVAWTRWSIGGVDGQVLLAYSDDQGQTWSEPVEVGSGTGANWGVHLAVGNDGSLYAACWNGTKPGSLWITHSTDGGTSFQPLHGYASHVDATGTEQYVPAEPTQPIHSDASLAVDTSSDQRTGSVYTAYPRWTRKGYRIVVTAFDADLSPELTRTVALRRTRRAYDEFNPTIAVDQGNGTVWACFYLTGSGTQRKLATYSCIDSRNGARTWSRTISAASAPSNETLRGAFNRTNYVDNDYASYEGLAVSNGVAHPIWTDSRKLKTLKEETYTTSVRAPH